MQGKVIIGTELDTKSFDAQIEQLEKKLEMLEKSADEEGMPEKFKRSAEETRDLNAEIEKTKNRLTDLYKKQAQLNKPMINKENYTGIKKSIDSISNSVSGVIKKVSKWALAVFSIRSAYLFVRRAMSTLTENDDQLRADIDYIRNALAYTIEPIVRKIVDLAKQLLNYIGFIVYRLTGKNIFAGANKNLKSANKEATKLAKTIAGFDEMNVLQDNTSSAGGGGEAMPSFKLGDYSEAEAKLKKLKDDLLDLYNEMGRTLYETDFSVWTKGFGNWDLAVYGVIQTIHGLWGMVINIFKIFEGLWKTGKGLVTGDTELIKEGFDDLFSGLWDWIKSTFETIVGIKNSILGVFKGLFLTMWGWLVDWINKGIGKFNEFRDKVANVWSSIRDKIRNTIQSIQDYLSNKFGLMGKAIGSAISYSFKGIINQTLSIIESILNKPINAINSFIGIITSYLPIRINRLSTFHFPRLAQGGIVNNPGNGVFMGGYVAGERGPEAVLPLTDETFDRLGLAIGRHTSINATIPVYAYNRQVAREVRRIEANQSFAMNR